MNLKNISHHYHEIEEFLMHAYETEKKTGYYVLISYDKDDNEIKRKAFINFTHEYVEPYMQTRKSNKRADWCYIHDEEMECYNEDGDHDDYHCRRCEKSKEELEEEEKIRKRYEEHEKKYRKK